LTFSGNFSFYKSDLLPPRSSFLNEVQIIGLVAIISIDRDATAAGQDYVDAALSQMLGNVGGDFTDGHVLQGFQSGFPFRLGRRLLARSSVRRASG